MIAGGMTTRWLRPPSPRRPDNYGMHSGAEIASLTRYGSEPMEEVALAGGHLYLAVMRAWLKGFIDMGCVSSNAHIIEINGPIGRMRHELRVKFPQCGDFRRPLPPARPRSLIW
jgi:hypothetical protein